MKRLFVLGIAFAFCARGTFAQMSLLPEPCKGKAGEELDKCVRDITPAQQTQRVEPYQAVDDPARMVNCLRMHPADVNFCIRRNEVILECRNAFKHPDFNECFNTYIVRAEKPKAANCQREKPDQRAKCTSRNALVAKCSADPLRYFRCLDAK
jgi:hypothetical protein